MADIINFKSKRKELTRAGKEKKAGENRAKFGRNKAEKMHDRLEKNREDKEHAGHRIDDGADEEEEKE